MSEKLHYRKKRSREVALKGQSCLKKLRGEERLKVEQSLKSFVEEDLSDSAASDSDNDEVSNNGSVNFQSRYLEQHLMQEDQHL